MGGAGVDQAESTADIHIRRLHALDEAVIASLAEVPVDCVAGDASIGFMHPLSHEHASAFFRRVAAGVTARERVLLVAEDAVGMCGSVQLVLAQPDNQAHRADLRSPERRAATAAF